jgi:hypothetical protein
MVRLLHFLAEKRHVFSHHHTGVQEMVPDCTLTYQYKFRVSYEKKKASITLAALITGEKRHGMLLCRLMWDFMQISTRYSESSHIHTDDIKHHC